MYPILIEFGFITIFSLWLFAAIGFGAGSYAFIALARKMRVKLDLVAEHGMHLMLLSLFTARGAFIISHPDFYFSNISLKTVFDLLAIWDKGLSFLGAAAGLIGGLIYLHRKHYAKGLHELLDIVAPALLIGMVLGDIGALLDGINYGSPTGLPWGITFQNANVKYISPVHPTQIYSAIYTLAIAIMLIKLLRILKGRLPGFTAELALFSYSLARFFEEFMRGDETIKLWLVRTAHLASLAGIIIAGFLIYRRYANSAGGDPDGILAGTLRRVRTKIITRRI